MHKCCNNQKLTRAYIVIGRLKFKAWHCSYCNEVIADTNAITGFFLKILVPFWDGKVALPLD